MEVSDNIIAVLDDIGKRFGVVVDWTNSNILPYLKGLGNRIITREIATSVLWIVIAVIVLFVAKRIHKLSSDEVDSLEDTLDNADRIWYFEVIKCLTFIAMFICVIIVLTQIFEIVDCFILPETIIYKLLSVYLEH